jgi:kynurenine 3-monooxygenase
VLRKNLDVWLNRLFPHHWLPLYTMVAHTTIPYADAVERAERQERTLKRVALGVAVGAAALLGAALLRRRRRS